MEPLMGPLVDEPEQERAVTIRPDASPTLVVLAGGDGRAAGISCDTVVLGLAWIRRVVLTAERAGFGQILIAADRGTAKLEHLLAGTSARIVTPEGPATPLPAGRMVAMSLEVLPRSAWLRSLLEMPVEPDRLYADSSVGVIQTADPNAILSALRKTPTANGLAELKNHWPTVSKPLGNGGKFEIAATCDLPRAEDWLLAGLIKESEGFMSRHVERRISLSISRRLARTGVTPNTMTLVSVGVGLLGALFFLSTRPAFEAAGAVLFLLHSILDGCDGELARLKFQESRGGGILDFWGDNVVHVAVFASIAIGWSHARGESWPLFVGAAAALGTLLSAGFVYRETMVGVQEGPLFTSVSRSGESRLSRMADAMARRDFIYLVVLLSAFGKAHWVLVLAAVGAPIFFFVLLGIAWAERRRERNLT